LKSYDLYQEREIGEKEKKRVEFGYGETNEKEKKERKKLMEVACFRKHQRS
jgi:hypothetical protein